MSSAFLSFFFFILFRSLKDNWSEQAGVTPSLPTKKKKKRKRKILRVVNRYGVGLGWIGWGIPPPLYQTYDGLPNPYPPPTPPPPSPQPAGEAFFEANWTRGFLPARRMFRPPRVGQGGFGAVPETFWLSVAVGAGLRSKRPPGTGVELLRGICVFFFLNHHPTTSLLPTNIRTPPKLQIKAWRLDWETAQGNRSDKPP